MAAINDENKTWKYIDGDKAKDKKALSSCWIFRIKEDGKYTARLVVRGSEQRSEIDFENIYSSVIKSTSLHAMLAIAALILTTSIQV